MKRATRAHHWWNGSTAALFALASGRRKALNIWAAGSKAKKKQ